MSPRERDGARRIAQRFAGLLAFYPRTFRTHYGADFRATIEALAAEPRFRGLSGRIRLCLWLAGDVAGSALAEWRAESSRRVSRSVIPDQPRPRTIGDRMDAFIQDLQFALRTLRRAPGFAAVVVLSLALGIGANTLVYSALDGLVLHPFAFPDPDRLVAVGVTYPRISAERSFIETLSPPEYVDIQRGTPSLERVSAYDLGNRSISGGDHPERVFTAFVWGDPLSTIGLSPFLGRSFRAEETVTQGTALAVLSHRIWQARFASDSGIIGRSIRVNGQPVTVIGVLPPAALLLGTDLWLPMAVNPMDVPRKARQYAILARLRDGVTLGAANRELAQVAQRTDRDHRAEYAAYEGWRLEAAPWAEAVASTAGLRQAAFVLQGAVLLVLLIACANVAGLLLSRASTRAPEIAMRRALGARGGRLARQLLTEGMLLSLLGGGVGFAIAVLFMGPLTRALPEMLQGMGVAARPNGSVLLFTLGSAVAVGLVFGLTPALQVARGRLDSVFGQAGARSTTGRHTTRLRSGVLTLQVALSVVLLVAAGLLVRSFAELRRVELGFSPSQVLTMRLSLPREKYPRERIVPAMEELEARVQTIAGVRSAAASTQYPPGNVFSAPVSHPGETLRESEGRQADITNATPGFFATLGYRLQQGRLFTAADNERAPRVALLNETAAKRFFSGRSPVGERLFLGDTAYGVEVQVVGVTADVRNRGLDSPVAPEVFIPARQQQVEWNNQFFLLVRTAGDPMRMLPAVREQLKAMDPDQPVYPISTVETELGDALLKRRAAMAFLLTFALISLVLACVGIYGLVSYAVNERVREIGIRMALGALARDVRRLVLRQVMIIVGVGALAGLLLSVAAAGSMRALVFGVSPTDPATLAVVAILLPLVAIAAAALPARRATRIDPVEALREG